MKSAYELAMERLEKTSPSLSLTEDQKKEIADVDSVYRAKDRRKRAVPQESDQQGAECRQVRRNGIAGEATRVGNPTITGGVRSEERKAARALCEIGSGGSPNHSGTIEFNRLYLRTPSFAAFR